MPRVTMRIDEALLAQLQKVCLKHGVTLSDVARRSMLYYLNSLPHLSELEIEVMHRAERKREQTMEMDLPKDLHDGAMRLVTIWESIEREEGHLRRIGILTTRDYDSWVKLLEANKRPLSKYEDGERLVEKLDMLITRLHQEQKKVREEQARYTT